MRKKNNTVIIVVLGVVISFVLGWYFSTKKKAIETATIEQAVDFAKNEGLNYLKKETDVTKAWGNQLLNTWKQIWK